MHKKSFLLVAGIFLVLGGLQMTAQTLDLPTSKRILGEAPGRPQKINSLPISIAISPDQRYIVTVNAGYGAVESKNQQSLAVLDTKTGAIGDFPDYRTPVKAEQTLYSGLAFSRDGKRIFASMASMSDPDGGNGVIVYKFSDGKISPEHFLRIPAQKLAAGKSTLLMGGGKGVPYPAAIEVIGAAGAEKLLVANNLADNVILIDADKGTIEKSFDLSDSQVVPATYPVALAVEKGEKRAFVALWNASQIVELDLVQGTVARKLALFKPSSVMIPGSHPCAFLISPDGKTLYVALANRDAVAAVDIASGHFAVKGYFDTRLPGQSYFGSQPVALAQNAAGDRLYAANSAGDSVAVIDPKTLTPKVSKRGMAEPIGFIPTEWMPMSLAFLPTASGGTLYVATDKGKGTGPNDFAAKGAILRKHDGYTFTYIPSLLHGSIATIPSAEIDKNLAEWTDITLDSNRMKEAQKKIVFANGGNPIKHVIYLIKENRSYDQIFGDLSHNGKPVGNGDPKLAMYGAKITPNEHKLALRFGVLDNFFDSGEVSGDGHVWSTAGIGSDYLEKTWPQSYRGGQHTYDYEGVVANGYPLFQHIPDVNEPDSGYLWTNMAAHGKTYYHFGEFIASEFCDTKKVNDPTAGPMLSGRKCPVSAIPPGGNIPALWGGGTNIWHWPIPLLAVNIPTKRELVGHFAPEAPDFNLMIPDQIRVNIFLRHFNNWLVDRKAGRDSMPEFILFRLPNDHTRGTRPGGPTPQSSVADNDLALGRLVEAISHSPYWDDTAIFVLEDDAQNGPDHVEAHRSIALVISKYAPHGKDGAPVVDSTFYTTVSMIRTMESLLGLPPMNNNDAFCSQFASLFTGPGDQPPYDADTMNRDNGLIYLANDKNAVGARASMKMDFTHEDRVPTDKLNIILWKDAMGNAPIPAVLKMNAKRHTHKADNDD